MRTSSRDIPVKVCEASLEGGEDSGCFPGRRVLQADGLVTQGPAVGVLGVEGVGVEGAGVETAGVEGAGC